MIIPGVKPEEEIVKLYLVQHGHAVPEEENPERPLSEKGRTDVARMAEFLGMWGVRVEKIVHSGKTRARQTAEILAPALGALDKVEMTAGLNPGDPVAPWADRVAEWNEDCMLVGHQPFMGRLAARLVTGRDNPDVARYEPGSVVCVERSPEGTWAITCMVRPGDLGRQLPVAG